MQHGVTLPAGHKETMHEVATFLQLFLQKDQMSMDFFRLQLLVAPCYYSPGKLHPGLREPSHL